jgi:hypothetical protein
VRGVGVSVGVASLLRGRHIPARRQDVRFTREFAFGMSSFPHPTSTAPEPSPPRAEQAFTPGAIEGTLHRIRSLARAVFVSQRAAWLVAGFFAAVLVLSLIDYFLRLPAAIRWIHWTGLAMGAMWWISQRILPALSFRPSLTDLALRLEQHPQARAHGLRHVLASGVEFAGAAPPQTEEGRTLTQVVVLQSAQRFAAFRRKASFLNLRPLAIAMCALALAALVVTTLAVAAPDFLRTGTQRTLAPWSQAAWPKRTLVYDGGAPAAHPMGVTLPLRALLARSDRPADKTDVTLVYRRITSQGKGPERRLLLTPQNRRASIAAPGKGLVEGELFERLLDPSLFAAEQGSPETALEYWFSTVDDQTQTRRVRIVLPPALTEIRATVTPPPYAASVTQTRPTTFTSGTVDVWSRPSTRGIIPAVLAGSQVDLTLKFNKPLPASPRRAEGSAADSVPDAAKAWLARLLPGIPEAAGATGTHEGDTVTISLTASSPLRVPISLVDEHGITSTGEDLLRIEVVEDRAPSAIVIEPPQDEAVLATAVLDVAAEGRDDVGLEFVRLTRQTARVPRDSAGAPPAIDDGETFEQAVTSGREAPAGTPPANLRAQSRLDLTPLRLVPGDEVLLVAHAQDIYVDAQGPRAPVLSAARRLRVIAESELVEQVQAELGAIREAAKRTEEEQSRITERLAQAGADWQAAAQSMPRQQSVQDRITPMQERIERLEQRVSRNRLDDNALAGLLEDAGHLLENAAASAETAGESLERLARDDGRAADDPARAQAAEEFQQSQQQVRDNLEQLANLLDRGQDDWAVRRSIERMLTQQQQLRAQTAALGQETQGQSPEQLSENQREDLARLAREQRQLAERAGAMMQSIDQRAEQMEQADPSLAEAFREASRQARQEQLTNSQQEAAQQIQQNQSGKAQDAQQQAERAISQMLDALEEGQRRRDEALRRILADVIQSIEQLVSQQETELARAADALAGNAPGVGLDAGMAALNRNTLAVRRTIAEQVRQGERLVALLANAAEAQAAAIPALRSTPPDLLEADRSERVSLQRLRDALEEAVRMEEQAAQRDEDRRRRELRREYQEMLELQAAVAGDSAPLFDVQLSRRQVADARGLGQRQETLRQRMADMRSSTQEFEEARLFDYAHQRYDRAAGNAAQPLLDGRVPPTVRREHATAIAILRGLVDALDEAQRQRDEFQDAQGGGQGEGGEGQDQPPPLIPPLAELKLLRAIQAEAAERTRSAAEGQPEEIDTVTTLQRDLSEFAEELLERITRENQERSDPREERR